MLEGLRDLRLVDLLDVLALAALAFFVLEWLWRTRYRRLAVRLFPLALAIFVASAADMYMTLRALTMILAVLAIALIVVFQEEIRRGFERLAAPRPDSGRASAIPLDLVQETVDAAFAMAADRIGALIVFRGREPLERLTTEGIFLEGRLSSVLLRSIFETGSPGHDGAVLVESGRVARFAVQLPLAKSSARGVSGTRHAAALGIAERSDALAVVVSEERGDVSVAHGGAIAGMASADELAQRLTRYLTRRSETMTAPPRWPALARTGALASVSVAAAALLFWLFASRADVLQRTYEIPIEYRNLPETLSLAPPEPAAVRVTLSGAERDIDSLDRDALALGLDAAAMAPGRGSIRLSADMLELPPEVAVLDIEPERVEVLARELVAVTLPVRLRTSGTAAGYETDELSVEPDEVTVWLPTEAARSLSALETEVLDLSRVDLSEPLRVPLRLPEGARVAASDATVRVKVEPTEGPS